MMSFVATPRTDWEGWDYIQGDLHGECGSLAVSRYYHIMNLVFQKEDLQLSLRTKDNNWTKWKGFYQYPINQLMDAFEIHRGLLDNEIIIESDYPTYEENYEAARYIGTLLESKGYVPHYYFSGNKSIHICVYLDYTMFTVLPEELQVGLRAIWKTKGTFLKHFIKFIREKLITCWGMNQREFDSGLIQGTHLIRSELSKNKLGYKTFLGYTHFDIPPIPYICNEDNRVYPQVGEIKLSRPLEFEGLCRDFIDNRNTKPKNKYAGSLSRFLDKPRGIHPCVKWLLSDEFCASQDGRNRAMFILTNELKRVYGTEDAKVIIMDWINKNGAEITKQEVDYRLKKSKEYSIGKKFIHAFLRELGFIKCGGCKQKI